MTNVQDYLRESHMPHIWCPGCGNGIVMGNIIRAIDELGLDRDKTVIVSGIGCSSRAPGYMDFDTLHTAHGRALPFATGIKMANPDLHVIVISGDGDATGKFATTAVYGNIDRPFDLVNLAGGAGATYVARGSVYHAMQTKNYIKHAIEHKGFSVVECLSTCPTYYGRRNKIGDAVSMMERLRDDCTMLKPGVTEYDKPFVIGEFVNKEAKEYTEAYDEVIMKAGGKK